MSQRRPMLIVLLLSLCLGAPRLAPAQLAGVQPVVEVGANLAHNAITATQSVITAIESVLQTANMVLELTPVEEVIVGGQIAEDMALLAEIVVSAELLWYDLQSLESQITVLFGLDNAPDTRTALDGRLLEIRQFYYNSLTFAMRTQTLVMTMFRTVEHLSRLIDAVGSLIGNMQSNQTLIQTNTTISKTLAVMEVQQAAWQRADTLDRLAQGVILASLDKINLKRLEDHPRH